MKRKLLLMFKILTVTIFLIAALYIEISLRINNIDMSEFRLFITYPLEHISAIIYLIIAYIAVKKRVDKIA